MMNEVLPAILPRNAEDLADKAELVSGLAPVVHLDVLETDIWAPIDVEFEAHLMVANPESILGRWIERGAKRVIVHYLTEEILAERHAVEIGLGVELDVPIENVLKKVPNVDFIHLMSIDALGTQGDNFESKIFERIKAILRVYPESVISVDGGVDLNNADDLFDAGVERLVVGSAIFKASDPAEVLEDLLELAQTYVSH